METALLILTVGFLMLASFIVGASLAGAKKEPSDSKPTIANPLEVFRKNESKKELKRQEQELSTIMQNIENYDGSSSGQKDVGR